MLNNLSGDRSPNLTLNWENPEAIVNEALEEITQLHVEHSHKGKDSLNPFKVIAAYEEAILMQDEIYN